MGIISRFNITIISLSIVCLTFFTSFHYSRRINRIIDAHVHVHPSPEDPVRLKDFLTQAHENFIMAAISHLPTEHPTPNTTASSTFQFIRCGAVGEDMTIEIMEPALSDGRVKCLKVYLGYLDYFASDPHYLPFYSLAEKYDVPVVFHTGDTYDKMGKVKYADPLTIDEVAVDYPKVKFVLAHMGNPWFQSAAELVYKNDNVYTDTSGLLLGDISKETGETIDELIVKPVHWFYLYVENPKKILFGTDWPLVETAPYIEAIKRAIPEEAWNDVFYQNAATLFKIQNP